jgi:hypothetical protein
VPCNFNLALSRPSFLLQCNPRSQSLPGPSSPIHFSGAWRCKRRKHTSMYALSLPSSKKGLVQWIPWLLIAPDRRAHIRVPIPLDHLAAAVSPVRCLQSNSNSRSVIPHIIRAQRASPCLSGSRSINNEGPLGYMAGPGCLPRMNVVFASRDNKDPTTTSYKVLEARMEKVLCKSFVPATSQFACLFLPGALKTLPGVSR